MSKILDNPFCMGLGSVFAVASPFQTLCAISAIKNLSISEYEMIVVYSDRFYQVKQILELYGISYKLKNVGKYRWRMRLWMLYAAIHRHGKYKRLFVGDFRSEMLLYYGLLSVDDGASVVYIDDGNVSISLFNNAIEFSIGKYQQFISKRRHLTFLKHFYSIYRNLPRTNYDIEYNNLSLLDNNLHSCERGIFFVGTNTLLFCKSLDINFEKYYSILEQQLKNIRNCNQDVDLIYIPHGKDKSEEVKRICLSNNIRYERLNVPVEMISYAINITPIQVYGFTSSALYNFKQMFPECKVYNILIHPNINSNTYEEYLSISKYYNDNGIKQVDVHLKN